MEKNWLERTELLYGKETIEKLSTKNVLVVGMGGVGSFAAEFICRAGVGNMTIVDGDVVDITNKNRQLVALTSTVGKSKVHEMGKRLLDINPNLNLTIINEFLSPQRAAEIVTHEFDCVLDCIDSITPKLELMRNCIRKKIKIVSSMGAGGKMDPLKIQVRDISKTKNCRLAKTIKRRLHSAGFHKGVRAVYSEEHIKRDSLRLTNGENFKKSFYGTNSYMPALFGLNASAEAIRILMKEEKSNPS